MLDPQSTQIRRDPLTGDTVLMASQRLARPSDFVTLAHAQRDVDCPFCPENEAETPLPRCDYPASGNKNATHADADPSADVSWLARVVPNRYPAVEPSRGRHLVVIESPRHVSTWAELTCEERLQTLSAYQDQLSRNEEAGLAYTQIFKNCGADAGASIIHSHSQILATPFIPPRIEVRVRGASDYYQRTQRCFFCDLTREEMDGDLANVVCESTHFVAVCPEFSRFPHETWLLPKQHQCQFKGLTREMLSELATMMGQVTKAFQAVIPQAAYNWMLQTAPHAEAEEAGAGFAHLEESYHWHLEMFPRLAKLGGYELATGGFINIVNPSDAAEQLAANHPQHTAQPVPRRKTS